MFWGNAAEACEWPCLSWYMVHGMAGGAGPWWKTRFAKEGIGPMRRRLPDLATGATF